MSNGELVCQWDYLPYKREMSISPYVRDGIIVRVSDGSSVGYGEIAPWAGRTESYEKCLLWCKAHCGAQKSQRVLDHSQSLGCVSFGVSSALEMMQSQSYFGGLKNNTALLYEDVLRQARDYVDLGYRDMKWKVGRGVLRDELILFKQLHSYVSNHGMRLRLDANGLLDDASFSAWLKVLHDYRVEYLEQPLAAGSERSMQEGSLRSGVAIALDESCDSLNDLERFHDWPSALVVKPSWAGSYSEVRQCLIKKKNCVLSSAFETSIGLMHVLNLSQYSNNKSLGLGTVHYFKDDLSFHDISSSDIKNPKDTLRQCDMLWDRIAKKWNVIG